MSLRGNFPPAFQKTVKRQPKSITQIHAVDDPNFSNAALSKGFPTKKKKKRNTPQNRPNANTVPFRRGHMPQSTCSRSAPPNKLTS